MANKYLRSTDGNDADDGSTWALANATMVGLAADMSAGDTGFTSQVHAETDSGGTGMTVVFPGTVASPNKIICANDAAEPPTATATTGSVTRTGTGSGAIILMRGSFYMRGITLSAAAASTGCITLADSADLMQTYEECDFVITNTGTVARITYGSAITGNKNTVININCTLKFGNASQGIALQRGEYLWIGGGIDPASVAITKLFATAGVGVVKAAISNFDLSACASTLDICTSGFASIGSITLNRCKMPASWTGGLFSGDPVNPIFRVSMYNCDSADTNYKILVGDRQGTLRDETTLVMTGGASESWKVTTTANANETLTPFYTDWMAKRNASVGSAVTITVEILHDSTTDLTDGDIWLEVECLGTSGVPLGTFTSGKRGVLATAADHTNSSVTWTTTGLTNPNKQYLTVSVTPQEVGNIMVRVMVAKASYTVYINPEFSIT